MTNSSLAVHGRLCPICGSPERRAVLRLVSTPLGDRFAESQAGALALPAFPLDVARCESCGHCFLPDLTAADDSYQHYLFATSQSPGLEASFAEVVSDIVLRHDLMDGELVLDIGANDGSWLQCFREAGCDVVGVEPAPGPARSTEDRGIPVVRDYFSEKSVRSPGLLTRTPRIVSMNYVFANMPDPLEALRDIGAIADDETVISVLTGYHPAQLAVGMFDYVYHEHVSYFSCRDLASMADSIGFVVTYAREVPLKGGSIHVEMQRAVDGREQSSLFSLMLKREAWLDQPQDAQWTAIEGQVLETRGKMLTALRDARSAGLRIVGYGASHSTTTLQYALGIEADIDVIVDDHAAKIGRFAPGTGVPVLSSEALDDGAPSCVVVLAWQHGPRIRDSLRARGFSGTVITPFPTMSIERFG